MIFGFLPQNLKMRRWSWRSVWRGLVVWSRTGRKRSRHGADWRPSAVSCTSASPPVQTDPATWPDPQVTTSAVTSRYGMAMAAAWDRVHPRLTHRAAWEGHDGPLPVIEGTLIRLQVDHLPGDRDPKPVWLWFSRTGAAPGEVDQLW